MDAIGWDFLPFPDLEQSVRDDVEKLRNLGLIPDDITVSGAIYDVYTGELLGRSDLEALRKVR